LALVENKLSLDRRLQINKRQMKLKHAEKLRD
jgi:hypothetical protein